LLDGGVQDVATPEEILTSQAVDLTQKTKELLRGKVEVGSHLQYIVIDFFIVAPALDWYEYRLFKARHKLRPQYPVELTVGADRKIKATGPDELLRACSLIFSEQTTRHLVSELIALVKKRLEDDQARSGAGAEGQ